MYKSKIAALGAALALFSQVGYAAGIANDRAYMDFGPTYTFADSDRDSENGLGAYLGIGKRLSSWGTVEASAFATNFDDDGAGDDWDEWGAEFDGLLTWPKTENGWMPYLVGGVGALRSSFDGAKSTDPYVAAGLGVFKALQVTKSTQLGLRADARYRVTDIDNDKFPLIEDNAEDVVIRIGAVLFFGGAKPKAAAPTEATEAEPAPPPVVPSDAGPLTIVYFDFDKSVIKPEAKVKLDAAAETIKKLLAEDPSTVVDLKGHTDWMGTDGYNMALSERRGHAVRAYLAARGVPESAMVVTGYGETKPAATNETAEGRALNRRVEVELRE